MLGSPILGWTSALCLLSSVAVLCCGSGCQPAASFLDFDVDVSAGRRGLCSGGCPGHPQGACAHLLCPAGDQEGQGHHRRRCAALKLLRCTHAQAVCPSECHQHEMNLSWSVAGATAWQVCSLLSSAVNVCWGKTPSVACGPWHTKSGLVLAWPAECMGYARHSRAVMSCVGLRELSQPH